MESKVENYVSPENCRTSLNEILENIRNAQEKSEYESVKKYQENFTEKIKEVKNLFEKTQNICYNKIYRSSIKKYESFIKF